MTRVAATGKHTSDPENLGSTEQSPRLLANSHDDPESFPLDTVAPDHVHVLCFRAKLDEQVDMDIHVKVRMP